MNYQHILFVTDLNEDSYLVAEKVNGLLTVNTDAKLSVIHVVLDNIITGGYEIMPLFNYADDKEYVENNAQSLKQFMLDTDLKADKTEVVVALSTAGGIADYAEEHAVDLIVIGLHQRTGLLNNLLGNTASAVLNHAPCDVLTVMLTPPSNTDE